MSTSKNEKLLLPSGGYRRLKSFQLARLIFDITVRFVELYIDRTSRTRDQMTQAARSGVQNIAEGSIDAATSAKLELNLYNVARGSLEELKLDYQDYLRQRNFPEWQTEHPLSQEFIRRRICDKSGFREFIAWTERNSGPDQKSASVANAAILLINAASYFLKRQIDAKINQFEQNGGFSEHLTRLRNAGRNNQTGVEEI